VVISSGATAITIAPAMTDKAKHVTMLRRIPSYIGSVPRYDGLAKLEVLAAFTHRWARGSISPHDV
jgi:cation diffusion facilitator CzcD-associated flavoprotein CzcO